MSSFSWEMDHFAVIKDLCPVMHREGGRYIRAHRRGMGSPEGLRGTIEALYQSGNRADLPLSEKSGVGSPD